jgi:predicted nucleotide-binding protein
MTIDEALADLNNAILDLQSADYDTYARPLQKMAATLANPVLKATNDELKAGVDFDEFVASADHRGMGGAVLTWPVEKAKELGLTLILIERGAADPNWFMDFAHQHYEAGSKLIAGIRKLTSSAIIPFGRDYRAYVVSKNASSFHARPRGGTDRSKVFIVHGHEDAPREAAARLIEKLGLEPIILHEQTSRGMTVAEKLEAHGDVGFAVVIMTPDDVGRDKAESHDNERARQNVILELGYFLGRLGRDRVCALKKGDVEIPSDFDGVVYTPLDTHGAWRVALARELKAAGYSIDLNAAM